MTLGQILSYPMKLIPERTPSAQIPYLALGIVLTGAIFALDLSLPFGIANGGLYIAVALVGLLAWNRRYIVLGGVVGTALTIAKFFFFPPGTVFWMVFVNRGLAIGMIWITVVLCLLQLRAGDKLKAARDELEMRVKERTAELSEVNEELRRKNLFAQLHKDIAVAANETRSLKESMEYCLRRICDHTGWPVGHLYMTLDRVSTRLVPTTYWCLDSSGRYDAFRKITEATSFDFGEGLPGQVLAGGKPAWISDVTEEQNFPRAKFIEDIGVRSGFAFPILIGRDVVGVMEFFVPQVIKPDGELLGIMEQLGTQLGRVVERRRAEEDQERFLQSLKAQVNKLTCLYGVAESVATGKTMREVLQNLDSHIAPGFQFPDIARVKARFDGATYVSKPFDETPWKLAGEINTAGRACGSIEVYYTEERPKADNGPFLNEECHLIEALANLLSVAAEHKRAVEQIEKSREELRNLYHRHELIREEERARIAREVHDELAQALTAWTLDLAWVERRLPQNQSPLSEKIKSMSAHLEHILREVRRISAELRPQILDIMGLCEALKWQTGEFQNRTGIQCELVIEPEHIDLAPNLSTTLFRIYQETLTNVFRHAKASKVRTCFKKLQDGALTLEVMDNGKGIQADQSASATSFGIIGIRERALLWGGSVHIQGFPGKGTLVSVSIPIASQEKQHEG